MKALYAVPIELQPSLALNETITMYKLDGTLAVFYLVSSACQSHSRGDNYGVNPGGKAICGGSGIVARQAGLGEG